LAFKEGAWITVEVLSAKVLDGQLFVFTIEKYATRPQIEAELDGHVAFAVEKMYGTEGRRKCYATLI
jgi:hypothetical protein